jgi:hypothetical protein
MAKNAPTRTMQLYDRRRDEVSLDDAAPLSEKRSSLCYTIFLTVQCEGTVGYALGPLRS